MTYEKDELGRVWLNDGVLVPGEYQMWDDYLAWLAEGNEPTPRAEL